MQVRQLAGATAVAPFGCEHHQVERVSALDLEPAGAAIAGFVGRVERLRHHAFVAGRESGFIEGSCFAHFARDEPGDVE